MTRWRVVRAPVSRYQDGPRYSVLSDREPGPRVGKPGELHGWEETWGDDVFWPTFEEACFSAASCNGKVSTANMRPQSAAEGGEGDA